MRWLAGWNEFCDMKNKDPYCVTVRVSVYMMANWQEITKPSCCEKTDPTAHAQIFTQLMSPSNTLTQAIA